MIGANKMIVSRYHIWYNMSDMSTGMEHESFADKFGDEEIEALQRAQRLLADVKSLADINFPGAAADDPLASQPQPGEVVQTSRRPFGRLRELGSIAAAFWRGFTGSYATEQQPEAPQHLVDERAFEAELRPLNELIRGGEGVDVEALFDGPAKFGPDARVRPLPVESMTLEVLRARERRLRESIWRMALEGTAKSPEAVRIDAELRTIQNRLEQLGQAWWD